MRQCAARLTSVLALALLLGVAEASVAPPRLSLKDAVRYALAHSPTYDTAQKQLEISRMQYDSAVAKLLPSLDFSTTNGLQNNVSIATTTGTNSIFAPNATSPWSSSLNVGLTESLYDNGVSLNGVGIARLNREIAELSRLKNRDSLTLEVATGFYRYSQATAMLEVRKLQQTALDKQFRTLTSQYEQGFKLRSDFLRIKAQVQRAEIERVSAEGELTRAEAGLRKLLGSGYGDEAAPIFEPVPATQAREKPLSFPEHPPAVQEFYDFRTAKLQQEVNDRRVTLVRRNYWPQVLLNSGVSYSNQSYLNSGSPFTAGQQLSWNVLLTLQGNLWDWGTRRRDVMAAEYERDIKKNDLSVGLLELGTQVTSLMADLGRLGRNYKLNRELLSLEEETNRTLEIQYRDGKVTYLDLITSLNALLDARTQLYSVYFEALSSQARYKYYDGKVYDDLVAQ